MCPCRIKVLISFKKVSLYFFLCIFSLKYSVLSCKYHIPQGASDFIFKQLLYCVCVHQENRRLIGHVMMVTHVHLWCQGQSGVSERRQSQVSPQTRPCLCVSRKNTRCLLERRWRALDTEPAVSRKTRAGGQADRRRVREVQRANASLKLSHRRAFVRLWGQKYTDLSWPHKWSN